VAAEAVTRKSRRVSLSITNTLSPMKLCTRQFHSNPLRGCAEGSRPHCRWCAKSQDVHTPRMIASDFPSKTLCGPFFLHPRGAGPRPSHDGRGRRQTGTSGPPIRPQARPHGRPCGFPVPPPFESQTYCHPERAKRVEGPAFPFVPINPTPAPFFWRGSAEGRLPHRRRWRTP
jgi:hypothetical protein